MNGNAPAFPAPPELSRDEKTGETVMVMDDRRGLTKREDFAARAAQGLLSANTHSRMTPQEVCVMAVDFADMLITQLSKEAKP